MMGLMKCETYPKDRDTRGTSKAQLVGRRDGTWHTRQGGGRLWGLGTGHPGTCRGATNCVHGGGDFCPGGFIPIFFRVFILVPGPREVLKVLYCGLVTHTTFRTLKAQEGVLGYLEIRYLN